MPIPKRVLEEMEREAQAYGDELRKALASISRGPQGIQRIQDGLFFVQGLEGASIPRGPQDIQPQKAPKRPNYRKLALAHYGSLGQVICVHCGFGIVEVLEVAHIDGNRSNNDLTNLAILCPNCHKMYDIGLIPRDVILTMRDREIRVDWKILMKDAGAKAAQTRRKSIDKKKWQEAGRKAAATRKKNSSAK